jgi:hypothetical protein
MLIDVSKEAGSYNVPKDYVLSRLALIHSMNPHRRIVTSHSGMHWDNKCDDIPVTMCSTQVLPTCPFFVASHHLYSSASFHENETRRNETKQNEAKQKQKQKSKSF